MIFSNTLRSNQYVEWALLTGISYFATVGLSGANNIQKYLFLDHQFVKFYDFIDPEIDTLSVECNYFMSDEDVYEVV